MLGRRAGGAGCPHHPPSSTLTLPRWYVPRSPASSNQSALIKTVSCIHVTPASTPLLLCGHEIWTLHRLLVFKCAGCIRNPAASCVIFFTMCRHFCRTKERQIILYALYYMQVLKLKKQKRNHSSQFSLKHTHTVVNTCASISSTLWVWLRRRAEVGMGGGWIDGYWE